VAVNERGEWWGSDEYEPFSSSQALSFKARSSPVSIVSTVSRLKAKPVGNGGKSYASLRDPWWGKRGSTEWTIDSRRRYIRRGSGLLRDMLPRRVALQAVKQM
jgi:hypothetical protein